MTLRIISLGWGVQSWTLAAMAALGEIEPVDYAIHADTTHEASATYAHAAKWTPWLEAHGVKVITVQATRANVVRESWSASAMIPAFTTDNETGSRGQERRQCTHDWKIMPIRRFIRTKLPSRPRPGSVVSILGISLDEWPRMRDSDVAYIRNSYPLVDRKMTRAACVAWLQDRGLDVPVKSACVFCPFHSLASWKRLKQAAGPDWTRAVEVDAAIRWIRAEAGHALYVHPARKPLPEAIRIPEDYGAEQMEFEMPCDGGACWV